MHVRTPQLPAEITCIQTTHRKNQMNREIVSCGEDGRWAPQRLKYNKGTLGCRTGVRGSVPEFLTKTYNIVNDPNTNSIISWSSSATSFIIWDHNEFSATVIPRFFKHNNLSSFVYQLNNYGFRKIGVDHEWEYENPNFQAGREYLLQNIRRRGQIRETQNNPSAHHRTIDNNRLEIKREILRNEISESKLEIERLRIRQSSTELRIAAAESEIRSFESKSEKVTAHWARAFAEFSKKVKMDKGGRDRKDDERTAAIGDGTAGSESDSGDYEHWKSIIQDCVNKESAGTGVQNNVSMELEGWIANLADQDQDAQLNNVTL